MIKVSVFYPNSEGAAFDMKYYCDQHVPLLRQLLGDACKGVEVEEGLGGGLPGQPAVYRAMGHLYFESLQSFQAAFGPHATAIMADTPNYTNLAPVVQVSTVKI